MVTGPAEISRRGLLAAAAGAAAAAAVPRLVNPFFALCMDTHDARRRNLAEQAALLAELGYDGAGHLWAEGVGERLATLDRFGLRLFQVYLRLDLGPQAKEAYDARIREVLPLLKGRGVDLALLILGGRPSEESQDGRALGHILELASMGEPHGVRIALYHHANHWLEKVEDAVRLARRARHPNVGIMFNLCHWLKTGDESRLRPLLEDAAPHLFALSINGADTGDEIKAGTGKWIQPLDSGSFNLKAFLAEFLRISYRGPIGLQCYGIPGDARDHLARSIGAWRKLKEGRS